MSEQATHSEFDRIAFCLSPEAFRESMSRTVDNLMTEVAGGNHVWAHLAGCDSATLRLDGTEAEALLQMLRQVKARIKAGRIVPCSATDAQDHLRPGASLRVAWSAPSKPVGA